MDLCCDFFPYALSRFYYIHWDSSSSPQKIDWYALRTLSEMLGSSGSWVDYSKPWWNSHSESHQHHSQNSDWKKSLATMVLYWTTGGVYQIILWDNASHWQSFGNTGHRYKLNPSPVPQKDKTESLTRVIPKKHIARMPQYPTLSPEVTVSNLTTRSYSIQSYHQKPQSSHLLVSRGSTWHRLVDSMLFCQRNPRTDKC